MRKTETSFRQFYKLIPHKTYLLLPKLLIYNYVDLNTDILFYEENIYFLT